MDWQLILIGFGASAAAGLMTGIGALPVLFIRRLPKRLEASLLGFAAGVMLAASFFSLIQPAIDHARGQFGGSLAASITVTAAVLAGAAAIYLINIYAPHEHFGTGRQGRGHEKLGRIWLFIIAIALHNFPEGLAVGVGFGGGDIANGRNLAIAIALQNAPEGLAVAVALASIGYSRLAALGVATATGLVEPVGGLLGITAVSLAEPVLPFALGFAAGAMLFVISHEIIPETHRERAEGLATAGLMGGLAVMTVLDTGFG